MSDSDLGLAPTGAAITPLQEAEGRLQSITDAAADAILMMDPQGRISFWNPAATLILGYEAGEALGQDLHRLLAPERFVAAHLTAFPQFQHQGTGAAVGRTLELAARRKDGTEITIELSLSRVALHDGWHAVGIIRDITGRKRLEADLKASEARFRLLFEQHLTVMLLIDPESGAILDANAAAAEFYGYSRDQLRAMRIEQINCLPPSRVTAERGQAAHQTKHRFIFPHRLADGSTRTVEVHSAPVVLDGRPILFSIVLDITERKRMEEQLRRNEERYRQAIEATSEGLWDLDLRTGVVVTNDRSAGLLGFAPGATGHTAAFWHRCLHPEDAAAVLRTEEDYLKGRIPHFEVEHRIITQQGEVRWLRTVGKIVARAPDGTPLRMVGTNTDITAQREQDEALRAAKAAAESASAAKSEFLAHMSHELRTPLNGVLGLAQVLAREPLPPQQRDLVGRIEAAGRSLLAIVNDVLDLAKIEAGQLRLEPRPFDPAALLAKLQRLLAPTAPRGLSSRSTPRRPPSAV